MVKKICCVYVFQDETGCPMYIGCTKDYNARINSHLKYDRLRYSNSWFYRWLNKQIAFEIPFFYEILEICTEDNYKEREIFWIKHAKENSMPIKNMTDGGDGNNNQFFSKESREKMRIANTGRKHSEESKQLMREKALGKIVSKETREKLRLHFTGVPCLESTKLLFSKKTLQFDLNNIFIKEFNSLTEASEYLDCRKSSLANAMKKKIPKFKGYIWKYK